MTASQPNEGITKEPRYWNEVKISNGDVPRNKGRFSIGAYCPYRSMVSDVGDTHIGEMLSIIPFRIMSFFRTSVTRHVKLSTYHEMEANMNDDKLNNVHKSSSKKKKTAKSLPLLNPNAAGIDIGSQQHYVAVPEGRDEVTVRAFAS